MEISSGSFWLCARQGALTWRWKSSTHPTGGSVSRTARLPSWGVDWRKPQAKRWPDEQKSHMRRSCWMRRQLSLKSDTCTESMDVDAAGISVKVGAHYPGRSHDMP